MKLLEVKAIAKNKGIKPTNMKKGDLIRAIQRAEGYVDCFNDKEAKKCDQTNCLWRQDCLINENE